MESWELPTSATIGGETYRIRSDFRVALDLLKILSDPEISDTTRTALAFEVFFPDYLSIPRERQEEAAEYMRWFLSGGGNATQPRRKLADWEQDFPLLISPVNRVLGYDARAVAYDFDANEGGLHWWTFLGAYMEIGDCLFAQVVSIRRKKSKGKRLDKHEQEFYRENRKLIDLRVTETDAEREILEAWM